VKLHLNGGGGEI